MAQRVKIVPRGKKITDPWEVAAGWLFAFGFLGIVLLYAFTGVGP